MAWKDNIGNIFDSYKEYCQSPHLDYDEKTILLWRGDRIPQNEDERELKKELDEFKRCGKSFEVHSNL